MDELINIEGLKGKWRETCIVVFAVFLVTVSLQAQPLVGNITFEQLLKKRETRMLVWTNSNGTTEKMEVIEMAIPITDPIRALTLDFEKKNYNYASVWLKPGLVVIHSMDLGDLKSSLEQSSFLNDRMPDSWGNLSKAGALPNGAHFMVDIDGTIYCLTPPVAKDGQTISYDRDDHQWFIRRHQDANPLAIGIENVTPANGDFTDLSDAQIDSNAKLIRWLNWFENGRITMITSHHTFNNERFLDSILGANNLRHLQKAFRTTGRKDVGDDVLRRIVTVSKKSK